MNKTPHPPAFGCHLLLQEKAILICSKQRVTPTDLKKLSGLLSFKLACSAILKGSKTFKRSNQSYYCHSKIQNQDNRLKGCINGFIDMESTSHIILV